MLKKRAWNKILQGVSTEVLREIRSWDYGVLILEKKDGLGVNTRFSKDSIVLITCPIQNRAQYLQIIGRSSRTRNLCRGVYYPITKLSQYQVEQQLTESNNVFLEELRKLLKFVSQKKSNSYVIEALDLAQKEKIKYHTQYRGLCVIYSIEQVPQGI